MAVNIEAIIFYVVLLDCVIYTLMTWGGKAKWYRKEFGIVARWFPLKKSFSLYYVFLVAWLGYTLYRMKILPW